MARITTVTEEADLRDAAAAASQQIMSNIPGVAAADAGSSLCLPVLTKGQHIHAAFHVARFLMETSLALATLLSMTLMVMGYFQDNIETMMPLCFIVFAIAFSLMRRIERWFMRWWPTRREGSLFRYPNALPSLPVYIRNPAGTRAWSEDFGVCLLDAQNQRVLIEGVRYRYVICGKNVLNLEECRNGGSISCMLTYTIGGQTLSLVIAQVPKALHAILLIFFLNLSSLHTHLLRQTLLPPSRTGAVPVADLEDYP